MPLTTASARCEAAQAREMEVPWFGASIPVEFLEGRGLSLRVTLPGRSRGGSGILREQMGEQRASSDSTRGKEALARRSFVDNKSWLPNVPASTRMRSSEMLMACEALVTNDGDDPFLRAL